MARAINLEAALRLADAGLHLFPCHGGGKRVKAPLLKGMGWQRVSTRRRQDIQAWCAQYPTCVFGVDLRKSGLIVIDCDVKTRDEETGFDGKEAFEALFDAHDQDRHLVPVVGSPSGGTHYYFKPRRGEDRGNGTGGLPLGIDVRGQGGYVIAPLMVMEEAGKEYEYVGDVNALVKPPILPDWLARVLDEKKKEQQEQEAATKPKSISVKPSISHVSHASLGRHAVAYINSAINGEFSALAAAVKGTRNSTLFDVALKIGIMIEAGWIGAAEAKSQLESIARAIGLETQETHNAIRNGFNIARGKTRTLPDDVIRKDEAEIITPQEGKLRAEIAQIIYLSFEKKRCQREGIKLVVEAVDGTVADAETGEIIETSPPPPAPITQELDYPQGLVGDIARWIVATARYPQPELAIGAALSIIGTVAGRQFSGPTFSGTHLYVLGLAPTGKGKDRPLKSIDQILRASGLEALIAPPDFASIQAVERTLIKSPLGVAPMDEFGDFIRRINSKRGTTHENAIPKILRGLWSSSFDPFATTQAAGRESHTIHWPAFGINGASTLRQFYSALEGTLLENGTLNRFLIINGRTKVEEREPPDTGLKVPDGIIDALKTIFNYSGEMLAATRTFGDATFNREEHIVKLNWCADGTEALYKAFSREMSDLMEEQPEAENFYGRAAEMALRIATIIALGRLEDEQIRQSDMEYAIAMVRQSCQFMAEGAADYMAENEHQANAQKIKRYLKAHGGRMSRTALTRILHNSIRGRDVNDLLAQMAEGGTLEVQEVKSKTAGRPAIYYQLRK